MTIKIRNSTNHWLWKKACIGTHLKLSVASSGTYSWRHAGLCKPSVGFKLRQGPCKRYSAASVRERKDVEREACMTRPLLLRSMHASVLTWQTRLPDTYESCENILKSHSQHDHGLEDNMTTWYKKSAQISVCKTNCWVIESRWCSTNNYSKRKMKRVLAQAINSLIGVGDNFEIITLQTTTYKKTVSRLKRFS